MHMDEAVKASREKLCDQTYMVVGEPGLRGERPSHVPYYIYK